MPNNLDLKNIIDGQGYYIFPRKSSPMEVDSLMTYCSVQPTCRTPLSPKNTSQWWDEISLSPDSIAANIIFDKSSRITTERSFSQICEEAYWCNLYQVGEHIPKHVDKTGDLQIIMSLIAPKKDNGGQLILHLNKKTEIDLEPGRKLLFDATKTPHETSPLVATESCASPKRFVAICRIYLRKQ